jgi:hypothetical protein
LWSGTPDLLSRVLLSHNDPVKALLVDQQRQILIVPAGWWFPLLAHYRRDSKND